MKKLLSIIAAVMLCLTLVFSITACAGGGSTANGSQDNSSSTTITYNDTMTVGTTMIFDAANRSNYNYDVLSGAFTQLALVSANEDCSFLPAFASYSTSIDGLTWTFSVVENLKWHDGANATAEDILFTFNYADEIEGGHYLKDVVTLEGTQAKMFTAATVSADKMSIDLVLAQTNPRLLSTLALLKILPKHIYSNETVDYIPYADVSDENSRIGCGPFKFLDYSSEANTLSFIYTETWTSYVPSVKKVVFKTYSADTIYLAVMSGDIDMIYNYSTGVSSNYVDFLLKNNSLSIKSIETEALPAVLAFNTDGATNTSSAKDLIANVNFRKAISLALNYESIKDIFSSSYGKLPNAGIVSNATFGYSETSVLSQDIVEAKTLIEGLGATKAETDEYYKLNAADIEFNIAYRTNKEVNARIVEYIATNLKEVGIKVTATPYATVGEYQSLLASRNYDCVLFGATSYGVAKGVGLASIYFDYSNETQGISQVNTTEFDAILNNLTNATDIASYVEAAEACQNYYAEYIPAIALYYDNSIQVYNKKLDGFVVDRVFGMLNIKTFETLTKKN